MVTSLDTQIVRDGCHKPPLDHKSLFEQFSRSFLLFNKRERDKWTVSHCYWKDEKWRKLLARLPHARHFFAYSEMGNYRASPRYNVFMAYHLLVSHEPVWMEHQGYILPLDVSSRFDLKGPALGFAG